MTRYHRSTAWLRHVADEKPRPAVKGARVVGKALEKIEKPRIAPVAVAGKPHDLPVGTVDRKRHAAGEASFGVGAYRAGGERRRRRHGAKQLFGGRTLWSGLFGCFGRRSPGSHTGKPLCLRNTFGRNGSAKREQQEAQNSPFALVTPYGKRNGSAETAKLTIGSQSSSFRFGLTWNTSKLRGKMGELRRRPRLFAAFNNIETRVVAGSARHAEAQSEP